MSRDIQYNILGIRELDDLFSSLKTSQQKAQLIAAFRKASKPLVSKSKSNLLARSRARASGNLYRSIGVIPHRRLPILKIGARASGRWAGYHGHLIDAGTTEREYTSKSGKTHSTGAVRPTNFFKDSVQQEQSRVVDAVRDELIREMVMRIVKAQSKGKSLW